MKLTITDWKGHRRLWGTSKTLEEGRQGTVAVRARATAARMERCGGLPEGRGRIVRAWGGTGWGQ